MTPFPHETIQTLWFDFGFGAGQATFVFCSFSLSYTFFTRTRLVSPIFHFIFYSLFHINLLLTNNRFLLLVASSKVHRLVLVQSLSKLLWGDRKPMVYGQVCCQLPRNGGLGMPDLESHCLVGRWAYLSRSLSKDTVWGQKVRDVFLRLGSDLEAKGRHKVVGKLSRSSDLSRSRKKLY